MSRDDQVVVSEKTLCVASTWSVEQKQVSVRLVELAMSTPITSLLQTQNGAENTQPSGYDGDEYDPAFQGGAYLPGSKRERRGTLQSVKYHEEQAPFQLIPYHPYKNNYEKYIYSHLPILFWFPRYKWKSYFIYDIMSGATAIVMVIPQSMGFALIAGLPSINGLWAACIGHSVYSLFGTCGQLIMAPAALIALMVVEILRDIPGIEDNVELKIAYSSCLAFQTGIIALVLGILNAGALANIMAQPVVVGFAAGAAILIGFSQFEFLFKIDISDSELFVSFYHFIRDIGDIHAETLLLSLVCVVILLMHKFAVKRKKFSWLKFVPIAFILVIISTIISGYIGEKKSGWEIIGDEVYNGLPQFSNFFTLIDMDIFWSLWIQSLLITIVGYIETIAVGVQFAEKHGYSINGSQELIALGIVNLFGCWFQIYPITCVLSLAAVIEDVGALTPLYSAIAGVGITLITWWFATLFTYLPVAVLASVVTVGVSNLIDIPEIKKIWKMSRKDFVIFCFTFIMTLILGVDFGVLVGIICSLLMFVYQTIRPEYGRIGKTKDGQYKFIKYNDDENNNNDNAKTRDDVLILRWDEVLFFANSQLFKDRIKRDITYFLNSSDDEYEYGDWCLILCFDSINHIDYTSMEALNALITEIKHKYEECTLLATYNVHFNIYGSLKKAGIIDLIKKENIFGSIGDAEISWDKRCKKNNIENNIVGNGINQSLYGVDHETEMSEMESINKI